MKKRISFFVCLVFFSLACVMSAASGSAPIGKVKRVPVPYQVKTATAESPRTCAEVIAEEAVHLRGGPSATSAILNHLRNGDQVQVKGTSAGDWWRVKSGEEVGFVRSIYLEEVECVK